MQRFAIIALVVSSSLAWAQSSDAGAPPPNGPVHPNAEDADKIDTHDVAPLLQSAFAYDAKAPLGLKEVGREERGDVVIRDVRIASPAGRGELVAYIVVSPGAGKVPGILFAHWL